MGFPRQEYWSSLSLSTPGNPSDPGIEPVSLVSPALADGFLLRGPAGKPENSKIMRFEFYYSFFTQ